MNEGIVCKVWNISATKKKGSKSQLSDSINYIFDDEKTEAKLSAESIEQFNKKQLGRECRYIENDIKTVDGAYIGVQNLVSSDVHGAVKEMMDVKKFYGKMDGRTALHGIISLPVEESDKDRAPDLMALCSDVMKKIFPNHQAVFAVHTNTDNLHIHFIVNTVGLDGKKIHMPNNFISDVLQPCINEYAEKYGFTPNAEWNKAKTHKVSDYVSLKMILREAIDLAIESSESFEDFQENMVHMGYKINCGKYISLANSDMDKAIRTYQLGGNYTKEAIIERIMSRKLAFEQFYGKDTLRATMARSEIQDVFVPVIGTMKKYRDMRPDEREYVLQQLKEGKNPWRMRSNIKWQMKEISDELNMTVRANEYIKAYSNDGKVETALRTILDEKKKLAEEKKMLREYMKKYKPIIDIFHKMQNIERQAYLYEHEGRDEYRSEYEEYRSLTRRLKNGYEKKNSDVAQFLDAYKEQYQFLNSQIGELSKEYRELKKYAELKGINFIRGNDLWTFVDYESLQHDARLGNFDTEIRYLVSKHDPNVTIRIMKNPTTDLEGKLKQNVNVSLLSRYGEILEECELSQGVDSLKKFVSKLENEYGLKDCESFKNDILAREYSAKCRRESSVSDDRNNKRNNVDARRNNLHSRPTYSFTQAINLLSVGEKKGMYVITNSDNPAYMGTVFSDRNGIRLKVSDLSGNYQEEFQIPSFKERNIDGFNLLMNISQKYGFSDEIYAFDSIEDARNYTSSKNIKNIK